MAIEISTDPERLDVDLVHAWLCDVYVAPDHRGSGVSTRLLEEVTAHLAGLRLKRVVLATEDAHGVYEPYGFAPLAHPERWMARKGPG